MQELVLLVLFDVSENRLRDKIIEKCKDYGLQRIQKSCFRGSLPASMKAGLVSDIKKIVGEKPAKIFIQPVCAKCCGYSVIINNEDSAV